MQSSTEPNRAPVSDSAHPAAKKSRVSWSLINLALDILLFLNFVALCWLAALTQFVFPRGATGDSWRLLGGAVEFWRNLQFAALSLFAGEVLVHIMLHWSWVCGVVENRFLSRIAGKKAAGDDGGRTIVGVMLLAATLLLMGIGLGVASYWMQRIES